MTAVSLHVDALRSSCSAAEALQQAAAQLIDCFGSQQYLNSSYLGPGERLDIQMIRLTLRALVGDLDDNRAVQGVRLAGAGHITQLRQGQAARQTYSDESPSV